MKPQAIQQGECTECGEGEENHSIRDRHLGEGGLGLRAACECGAESYIAITNEGVFVGGPISHENASWNES